MHSLPRTPPHSQPTRLGDPLTRALSQVDGCPRCPNTQPAGAAIPASDAWVIHFTCADCKHAWTRPWHDTVSNDVERNDQPNEGECA